MVNQQLYYFHQPLIGSTLRNGLLQTQPQNSFQNLLKLKVLEERPFCFDLLKDIFNGYFMSLFSLHGYLSVCSLAFKPAKLKRKLNKKMRIVFSWYNLLLQIHINKCCHEKDKENCYNYPKNETKYVIISNLAFAPIDEFDHFNFLLR